MIVLGSSHSLEELKKSSEATVFPTIVKRIEDLSLNANEYKVFGKKMINVKHCGMICYISGIPVVMFRIFSVPLLVCEMMKVML